MAGLMIIAMTLDPFRCNFDDDDDDDDDDDGGDCDDGRDDGSKASISFISP